MHAHCFIMCFIALFEIYAIGGITGSFIKGAGMKNVLLALSIIVGFSSSVYSQVYITPLPKGTIHGADVTYSDSDTVRIWRMLRFVLGSNFCDEL